MQRILSIAKNGQEVDQFFFNNVIMMYGNTRKCAPIFVGRCDHFLMGGGMVAYDMYGSAKSADRSVCGVLMQPLNEDTPLMTVDGTLHSTPNSFNPKLNRILATERIVKELFP